MQLSPDGESVNIYKNMPLKKMLFKSTDDNLINNEKRRLKKERIE